MAAMFHNRKATVESLASAGRESNATYQGNTYLEQTKKQMQKGRTHNSFGGKNKTMEDATANEVTKTEEEGNFIYF